MPRPGAHMEDKSLFNRILGKHVDARAAQNFKEKDFPQPRPCSIVDAPPIGRLDAHLSVAESFKGSSVFITGAVGFVGSVVLEQLLRVSPGIKAIYLIVRPKRNASAEERVASLLRRALFQKLYVDNQLPAEVRRKVITLTGDLMEPNLGLSHATLKQLTEEVTHVIHAAASISFEDPIMSLMNQNYEATKRLAGIAADMKNLKAFCYVSTAYVNSWKGQYDHIEEQLYPLHLSDGKLLYHAEVAAQLKSLDPEAANKKGLDIVQQVGLLKLTH
eukprot:jgi/Botrbrau1/22086/Bobra.0206s0013.1